jgi:hypothetical protein
MLCESHFFNMVLALNLASLGSSLATGFVWEKAAKADAAKAVNHQEITVIPPFE